MLSICSAKILPPTVMSGHAESSAWACCRRQGTEDRVQEQEHLHDEEHGQGEEHQYSTRLRGGEPSILVTCHSWLRLQPAKIKRKPRTISDQSQNLVGVDIVLLDLGAPRAQRRAASHASLHPTAKIPCRRVCTSLPEQAKPSQF